MQSRTIVFASTNAGKLAEVRKTLSAFGIEIVDPKSLQGSFGPLPEVEENGASYAENAALKARAFFSWCGQATLADDSGLEVAALNSGPGVHTARYAGPAASDAQNREKLLRELAAVSNRAACYRASLHLIESSGAVSLAEGRLDGSIAHAERGQGGFGYDPIFILAGGDKTLAELKEAGCVVKTHRILALEKLFSLT